jgi:hypothetical protein
MKGITLTQPWATLVAIGAKRIETRSWSTHYRGELAIHAAKGWPRECQALPHTEPFQTTLVNAGLPGPHSRYDGKQMPRGYIVAVARLAAIESTENLLAIAAAVGGLLPHELDFGNYAPGRYGWLLADVERLVEPIEYRGALGLWTVPDELSQQLQHADRVAA